MVNRLHLYSYVSKGGHTVHALPNKYKIWSVIRTNLSSAPISDNISDYWSC